MENWCCNCTKYSYLMENCSQLGRTANRNTRACGDFDNASSGVPRAQAHRLHRDVEALDGKPVLDVTVKRTNYDWG